MTDPNSPIIDFYPLDFDQDLNGKKADWEAIVKIPFIDEERLVKAMAGQGLRFSYSCSTYLTFAISTRTPTCAQRADPQARQLRQVRVQPRRADGVPVVSTGLLSASVQVPVY